MELTYIMTVLPDLLRKSPDDRFISGYCLLRRRQGKAQVFEDSQRCAHPGLLPEKRDQAVEVSDLLSLPPGNFY